MSNFSRLLPFAFLIRHFTQLSVQARFLAGKVHIGECSMWSWHRTMALLMVAGAMARAQLTIENPKHVEVSEQDAQVVFLTTARVIETEFRSPGTLENKFHVKLVLGQPGERFTIDDPSGNGTIYLERWNDGKFAVALMRLSMQHLLAPDRQKRMLMEIQRRSREIAPVPAAKLANQPIPSAPDPLSGTVRNNCTDTIADAAVRQVSCRPLPVGVR